MATLWDRSRQAFERILEESKRATERLVESAAEAGGAARARLDKARLERALFKRFAELGNRVYEQARAGITGQVLEDARTQELLQQVRDLDNELKKLHNQMKRD
jgi:phosphate uptake regulator